ncbi:SDR family oxidoreductase [uncultured Bacteroides sp.]|uniref:SDR family NAD(P)-dependent oxidoreductase n=1 Tax=uncultured Bacteroides sp. TaxID=162156 RepID=UPI00280BE694|nr:SDR family oxidoreductase [uncultured Bacteroides sp.]
MNSITDLSSKIIVVTGAGSGIGRSTCIVASSQGATVILLDLSEEGMKTTLSMMSGNGHGCYVIDLTNIDSLSNLVRTIINEYGEIHGLVHCAGISSRRPLNVIKRDNFLKLMDVNFFSFVELVKQLTKKGRMVDGGSVVAVSSISSIKGYKAKTEYCVSKSSVDAFVRCMALELSSRRIRINTVMPAIVNTPLAVKAQEINKVVNGEDFYAPLGASEPEEVANLIVFLLSDATKTITGTSLLIDGGATV